MRHAIWSTYAKEFDHAEYMRIVEHRAHGEAEGTRRWEERIAAAAVKREKALSVLPAVRREIAFTNMDG